MEHTHNVERTDNHALAAAVDVGSGAARSGAGAHRPGRHGAVAHDLLRETSAARVLMADMADILGDDAELIVGTIEGETQLVEVIDRGLERVLEINGLVEGIDTIIERLKARRDRLEHQRDTIKSLIGVAMEAGQIKRRETAAATISLRAVPPKAEIIDESAIPAKFWKPQDPKLDKRAVLEALKAHEAVPGATLSNGGSTISIKVS